MNPDKTQRETSLKDKTAKGLFWSGISSSTQQIFQLIFGIIMLRILTPEDYGIVGVLAIFTAIATMIQDGGFTIALINQKKIKHEDYNAVFWFNVITSCITYIFLFLCAPIISTFFNIEVLTAVTRILFLNFIFIGLGNAHYAYMSKKLMIKEKATSEVLSFLISGIIGIILAYYGFSYWAIVLQAVSYSFISTLIKWYYVPWAPSFNIHLQPLKRMFSFSIKIFLTSIFSKITENIFSILLGKFYDEKIVGYYTQGNKWATIGGTFITNMVNNVAMPILTQINDEKERQKNAFRKMLRFGAFVSFPLLLGLSFIGKDFLLIIGNSDKWQPVTPFLQLFCIWNSVYFIWSLYISILFAHKKSNIYLWGTIIVGSLQLTAIITLFNYGILPMLTAYICIYFIGLLFFHYYTNKLIGLKLFHVIKDIAPYLIITIGCILISWLITKNIEYIYLRFALKIILTALLYFTIVWMNNSTIIKECHAFIQKKLIK